MAQMPVKPTVLDDLIEDAKSQTVKNKVMARMRPSSMLNSISKVSTFIGAPLMSAGVVMAASTVFGGGLTGAAMHAGLSALLAAATPAAGAALGIIAVGMLFVAAAVATDYIASRIYQGCNFDNLEANADSTARHLVKELKVNNMCLTTEQSAPCAKEKEWTKTIEAQRQQPVTAEAAR